MKKYMLSILVSLFLVFYIGNSALAQEIISANKDNHNVDEICDNPAIIGYLGEGGITCEYFDDLFPGVYVAVELLNWTTWSNNPGSPEDAIVTDIVAYSSPNSFIVDGYCDLLDQFTSENITSGIHSYSNMIYIPMGCCGYFNLQKDVVPGVEWGFQVYFDADGIATVDAGASGAATFNFEYDSWHSNVIVIDLDADWAKYYFNGSVMVSWQWSLGCFGNPGAISLGSSNYYAWASVGNAALAYYDNACYSDNISFVPDIDVNPASLTIQQPALKENADQAGITHYDRIRSLQSDSFNIKNIGYDSLSVESISASATWLQISGYPATPFTINPWGSQNVAVDVDWEELGSAQQTDTITIASDDPDEPAVFVTVTAIPAMPASIIVEPSIQNLTYEQGSFVVTVQSNVDWEVVENCDWLSCDPASGQNDDTIIVSHEENMTAEIRSCIISIVGAEVSDSLTVVQDLTSISDNSENSGIQVYPNPFSSRTTIAFYQQSPGIVVIALYNHLGDLIDMIRESPAQGPQKIVWNAEELPAGIYYYRIETGNMLVSGKLVKIN